MIPAKIIKEFAYELSVPSTDILNSSFAESKVPVQWKKGIVPGYCSAFLFQNKALPLLTN